MCPESSSPSQDSPLSMAPWAPFYPKACFSVLKKLAVPRSGMIRWRAGGIVQGPSGDLTITSSLRKPDADTTDWSLNPDLWIRILGYCSQLTRAY